MKQCATDPEFAQRADRAQRTARANNDLVPVASDECRRGKTESASDRGSRRVDMIFLLTRFSMFACSAEIAHSNGDVCS